MGRQVNVKLILIIVGIIIAVAAVALYFKIEKDNESAAYAAWADKVIPEDEYEGIPEYTTAQFKKEIEGVKGKEVLAGRVGGMPIINFENALRNSDVKIKDVNGHFNLDIEHGNIDLENIILMKKI